MKTKFIVVVLFCCFLSPAFSQKSFLYAGTPTIQGYDQATTYARLSAKFSLPYGLAFDSRGYLYVSDAGANRIRLIFTDNTIGTRAGFSQGYNDDAGVNAQFDQPKGICVNSNNDLFVADYGNNCIRKVAAFTSAANAQTVTTFAGVAGTGGFQDGAATSAKFSSPSDVVVDATGNIYVADAGNNRIRKITSTGTVSTYAGTGTAGLVNGPRASAQFSAPTGLYLASNGDLYVADKMNSCIRKITASTGLVSTVVSGLWTPEDVWVLSGDLYITDKTRIWKYSGTTLTTMLGPSDNNMTGYKEDVGSAARFNFLGAIVYSTSEACFYVADQNNYVIRKATLTTPPSPPVPAFTANVTSITKGGSVIFTDQSTNTPTAWAWTFTGGNPAYYTSGGNVTVSYATAGKYSVKLKVTNAGGSDSLTKTDYITVGGTDIQDNPSGTIKVYPSVISDKLYIDFPASFPETADIRILDINGRTQLTLNSIKTHNSLTIDLSFLLKGYYIANITNTEGSSQYKFVKE